MLKDGQYKYVEDQARQEGHAESLIEMKWVTVHCWVKLTSQDPEALCVLSDSSKTAKLDPGEFLAHSNKRVLQMHNRNSTDLSVVSFCSYSSVINNTFECRFKKNSCSSTHN